MRRFQSIPGAVVALDHPVDGVCYSRRCRPFFPHFEEILLLHNVLTFLDDRIEPDANTSGRLAGERIPTHHLAALLHFSFFNRFFSFLERKKLGFSRYEFDLYLDVEIGESGVFQLIHIR